MDNNNKDWTGNKKTTFVQLGASNHSLSEREVNDFYSTDPRSLSIFLRALKRDGVSLHKNIWEPACGMGHLSNVLLDAGYNVFSSDLIDRGFGVPGVDFLKTIPGRQIPDFGDTYDILTNPPYKFAEAFVEHALSILPQGCLCIMFLKIQFLEGQARRKLFDVFPPKYVYVNSSRQTCYINGDMSKQISSASCYCWFVFEKGFIGSPVIRWI